MVPLFPWLPDWLVQDRDTLLLVTFAFVCASSIFYYEILFLQATKRRWLCLAYLILAGIVTLALQFETSLLLNYAVVLVVSHFLINVLGAKPAWVIAWHLTHIGACYFLDRLGGFFAPSPQYWSHMSGIDPFTPLMIWTARLSRLAQDLRRHPHPHHHQHSKEKSEESTSKHRTFSFFEFLAFSLMAPLVLCMPSVDLPDFDSLLIAEGKHKDAADRKGRWIAAIKRMAIAGGSGLILIALRSSFSVACLLNYDHWWQLLPRLYFVTLVFRMRLYFVWCLSEGFLLLHGFSSAEHNWYAMPPPLPSTSSINHP